MGLLERVADAWESITWWVGDKTPDSVKSAWQRFWFRATQVGQSVQAVVVRILLVVLYLLGVGSTWLLAAVLARRYLGLYKVGPPRDSYWLDAPEVPADRDHLLKQF